MLNINISQWVNGQWKAVTTVSAPTVAILAASVRGYVKLSLASKIPIRIELS